MAVMVLGNKGSRPAPVLPHTASFIVSQCKNSSLGLTPAKILLFVVFLWASKEAGEGNASLEACLSLKISEFRGTSDQERAEDQVQASASRQWPLYSKPVRTCSLQDQSLGLSVTCRLRAFSCRLKSPTDIERVEDGPLLPLVRCEIWQSFRRAKILHPCAQFLTQHFYVWKYILRKKSDCCTKMNGVGGGLGVWSW